jgi:acetylcholinesterase/cholinesterase
MHGGSSKPVYVGEHLAQIGQVIVVTFNYRVGALGFLAAPQAGLFGNYGLHDQLLAIEWVYENIAYFGGDSHRITIFGESAGAMSVGLHLLDDSKRRMFNGLILQSNPYGYHYRSITVAGFIGDSYLRALDCNTLTCLQSEPLDELIRSQDALIAMPRSIGDFFSWGPVVTESSEYKRLVAYYPRAAVSNVVVKQPLEELRNLRNLSHVPIIIGVNANEGVLFVHTMFPYVVGRTLYKSMLYMFYRRAAQLVMNQYEDVVFDMLQRSVQSGRKPDYRHVYCVCISAYRFI